MKSRSVVLLVLVAGLAGAGAWMAGSGEAAEAAAGVGQPLVPGLAGRLNDVAAISLITADEHFTVKREGEGWMIVERDGYPARFEVVKKTLVFLSELRTKEPKTSSPDLYAKLGVQDPEAPDSTSALVTLLDVGGQSMGAVIIGDSGSQRSTLYARRASEAQSWLVSGNLSLDRQATQWMATEAWKLAASRIRAVSTAHADGETLRVSRTAESEPNLQLEGVPEGMQPRTSNIGRIQHTVLDPLPFEDVAAVARHPLPENEPVVTTFETFDGLKAVVTTAKEAPAEAPAEGEDPPTPRTWATIEVSAGPEATEEVQAEARAAQERLAPWVYALAEWKAANLRKRMADMVSPVDPAPAAEPEPAPAPEGEAEPPADDQP